MRLPPRAVADASVGVKLIIPEEDSDRARNLFAALEGNPPMELFVPELFYLECASSVWKAVRRYGYSAADGAVGLEMLSMLNLRRVPVSEVVLRAFGIGNDLGITVYDASYVALCERIKVPLITADLRLARKLESTAIPAFSLDRFDG